MKKIFKIVGTPDVVNYPGLADLPTWKTETFESYPADDLAKFCPRLDADGLDLIKVIFIIH